MQLIAASPDDLPAIHALIEAAYRGDSARRGWSHEADLLDDQRTDLDELAAFIADPRQRLLWFDDGTGSAACVALTDKSQALTYLGLLTVDPARQAGGLGKQLLAAAEDQARTVFAANRIEMTVIAQRGELIAWYERRGYGRTGERRPFPVDGRDDLEFVVLEKQL